MEYTCANCGGTFQSDVSESDSLMEYQETFTEEMRAVDTELPAIVCDDCHKKMLAEISPDEWWRKRKARLSTSTPSPFGQV